MPRHFKPVKNQMKKSKHAAQSATSGVGSSTSDKTSSAQSAHDRDALEVLKEDHGKVEALFTKFEKAQHQQAQSEAARELCAAISNHARLMEDVVYPELRLHGVDEDLLDCAQVKLDGIKMLVNDLAEQRPDTPYYKAKIKILAEQMERHASEEHDDSFFAKAQEAGIDMSALGGKLQTRQQELTEKADGNRLEPLRIRSLGFSDQQEKSMAQGRYGQHYRGRDDDYGWQSYGGQRGRTSGEQDYYGRQHRADDPYQRDDDYYQPRPDSGRGGRYRQSEYGGDEDYGQRERRFEQGQYGRGEYGQSGRYDDQGLYGRTHRQPGTDDRFGGRGYRGERYGRTEEYRETRGGMRRGQGAWQNEDQERYGEGRMSSQRHGYDEDRQRFSQGPRDRRDYESDVERRSEGYGQRAGQAGYEDDYDDRRARSRRRTQDDDNDQMRRGRNGNGSRTSMF